MATARRLPEEDEVLPEDVVDLVDVPAAVICAACGQSDCPGCMELEARTASGVVLFVPWERPGSSFWTRFWGTTRASTEGAEAFFAGMPAGPVSPALSYAVLGESVAVGTSIVAIFGAGAALLFAVVPVFASHLLADAEFRAQLARMFVAAWLSFTTVLVGAHALHGWSLHRAAAREGADGDGREQRALRFGLYAAGWDVATSPFGLLVTLFTGGPRAVLAARAHAFHTPGRSTAAMLRGIYRLEGEVAAKARARSMTLTMIASTAGIVAALLAVAAASR